MNPECCDQLANKKLTGGGQSESTYCGRMSAHSALQLKIKQKREELSSLEVLEKAIPWDLLQGFDEEALWRLFIRA